MKAQNSIKYLVVAVIGLVATQMAYAQGVGNLGSLPTQFTTPIPPTGWTVGSPPAPIPVILDPTGPVWYKNFTGPNGGPFSYPAFAPPLPVQEFLQVDPASPPWTDWHEDVIGIDQFGIPDPGWIWVNPFIFVNGSTPTGLTITGAGTSNLSFFWTAPANPGDTVIIRKQLAYAGLPGTTFTGTLAIHEYPTPEPGSIGLLSIGGLLALRRWRTARTKSGSRM